MLSSIYQLAYRFEHNHDLRPNTLYLNHEHFNRLRNEFADPDDISGIGDYLGMHIVIAQEAAHPHLAHLHRSWHMTTNTWTPSRSMTVQNIHH